MNIAWFLIWGWKKKVWSVVKAYLNMCRFPLQAVSWIQPRDYSRGLHGASADESNWLELEYKEVCVC